MDLIELVTQERCDKLDKYFKKLIEETYEFKKNFESMMAEFQLINRVGEAPVLRVVNERNVPIVGEDMRRWHYSWNEKLCIDGTIRGKDCSKIIVDPIELTYHVKRIELGTFPQPNEVSRSYFYDKIVINRLPFDDEIREDGDIIFCRHPGICRGGDGNLINFPLPVASTVIFDGEDCYLIVPNKEDNLLYKNYNLWQMTHIQSQKVVSFLTSATAAMSNHTNFLFICGELYCIMNRREDDIHHTDFNPEEIVLDEVLIHVATMKTVDTDGYVPSRIIASKGNEVALINRNVVTFFEVAIDS